MIIVGGAYSEEVAYPERLAPLAGSGIRAATVLQYAVPTLITAVDGASESQLAAVTEGWEHAPKNIGRDGHVGFRYFTPVSTPTIDGVGVTLNRLVEADDDDTLIFGMIETAPSRQIRARRAVIDPQSPQGSSDPAARGIVADSTILSGNAREINSAAGAVGDLVSAAESVRDRDGHEAVIVRCGARGSLVADASGSVWLNASPTPFVWSLGTGDVYSAVLAQTWFSGATPREAATAASNSTAWWSSTKNPTIPAALLRGESIYDHFGVISPGLFTAAAQPRIYLAGPFFSLSERWLIETAMRVLEGLGSRPWSPYHQVGSGGNEVAQKDIEGLKECDVVLALLDGLDAGTIYEVGWAHAAGIPVIGYSTQVNAEANKMLVGMGGELHSDFTSALYRAVWVGQGAPAIPGRHVMPNDVDLKAGGAWG